MEPRISIITLGVADLERSYHFYTALGLTTTKTPDDGIVFFQTTGTCLALYPLEKFVDEVGQEYAADRPGTPGITLAHNTRERAEVDEILASAVAAGGSLVKAASDTFWGGYSGYFADPDGYLWEVAYADSWEFNDDGSLVID